MFDIRNRLLHSNQLHELANSKALYLAIKYDNNKLN